MLAVRTTIVHTAIGVDYTLKMWKKDYFIIGQNLCVRHGTALLLLPLTRSSSFSCLNQKKDTQLFVYLGFNWIDIPMILLYFIEAICNAYLPIPF